MGPLSLVEKKTASHCTWAVLHRALRIFTYSQNKDISLWQDIFVYIVIHTLLFSPLEYTNTFDPSTPSTTTDRASFATCPETVPEEGELSRWAVLQHKGLFATNSSRESREDSGIWGCTQPAPPFPSCTQTHKHTEVFLLNCLARFKIHWLPPTTSLQIHWYLLRSTKFTRLYFKCIPPWRLTTSPFTMQTRSRKSKTAKERHRPLTQKTPFPSSLSKNIWVLISLAAAHFD